MLGLGGRGAQLMHGVLGLLSSGSEWSVFSEACKVSVVGRLQMPIKGPAWLSPGKHGGLH